MSLYVPGGAARARLEGGAGLAGDEDTEQQDLVCLGREIARCAPDLSGPEAGALTTLAAATLSLGRSGSTRLPLDARLAGALEAAGVTEPGRVEAIRALVARAREAGEGPLGRVIGPPGGRTPLILEGEWLYAERMRVLDTRFCDRVRERLALPASEDDRALRHILKGVSDGPRPLTAEQRRAVRAALSLPLALITGGPGTGKTTILLSLLRALSWTGTPMTAVALAAPTGKAARRMQAALDAGLGDAPRDLAEAALAGLAPTPQTLHRLLGWSPARRRFARHENDPLPHRVVLVDEASMIDLAMMDRLFRAIGPTTRLVLVGDADQLPSVEAGAVFRDLCAALPVVRLTVNLRVAADETAQRIVTAAAAVNAGKLGEAFAGAVRTCSSADEIRFAGVEHLASPFPPVAEALLERWWQERVASLEDFERRVTRAFHLHSGALDPADGPELEALLAHHGRSRILCATRVRGLEAGALALNDRLVARLPAGGGRRRAGALPPGTPVLVERNDYERELWNGDQGLVVTVSEAGAQRSAVVFPRRAGFDVYPLETLPDLVAAFAMTVHKAQGSEYDHVAVVLPERDMPLLTRELIYTGLTRARRSALLVGPAELLARAVSRPLERYSGIAEGLGKTPR